MTRKKPKKQPQPPEGESPPAVDGVTWGSDTVRQKVAWIVTDCLPAYNVSILEGRKGTGKSTLLGSLIASWTAGWQVPGWTGLGKGRVLVVATEDPWDSVVLPRIEAAGGFPARVGKLEVTPPGQPSRWPRIPGEIALIEEKMRAAGAELLVLDPFDDLASDGCELNTTEGASAFFGALSLMAERNRWTVWCSRNVKKGRGHDLSDAGYGSGKIGNRARSVIRLDMHPYEPGLRVMSVVRCNWARSPYSQNYRLLSTEDGLARVEWAGACEIDPEAIAEGRGDAAERDEWAECDRVLCEVIGDSWTPLDTIKKEAEQSMISLRMLRRAKERLGLTWRRISFSGTGCVEWGPPPTGWPLALLASIGRGASMPLGGRLGALEPRSAAQLDSTRPPEPKAPNAPPPVAPPPADPEVPRVEP